MKRRQFGTIRRLGSGRYDARYWHLGLRHHAPATFASKADAGAWLAEQETAVRRGTWADPAAARTTLSTYADAWLARRTDLAPRTTELYRGLMRKHILDALGDTTLADLAPSQVAAWRAGLPVQIRSKRGDGEVTAAKAYRLLSEIMRSAVSDEIIVRNPCKVVRGGAETAGERGIVTVTELAELSASMPERLRVAVTLAAWCQLRRSEMLWLRRRDIDLLRGAVIVEPHDGWRPKSAAGRRDISIPPHVRAEVAAHLDRVVAPHPDAWVLSGVRGGQLRPAALYSAWHTARAAIGRPDLRLHDLRHTGLTLVAAQGATLAELMYRAGHSSPDAAMRYQHATRDRDRFLAEALSSAIMGTVTPIGHAEVTNDKA